MMPDYEQTGWVFDHGHCKGCRHLKVEQPTDIDPGCQFCEVLDNWRSHSDRCPRVALYKTAFKAARAKLRIEDVLDQHSEAFLDLVGQIIAGTIGDDDIKAGELIRSLYDECADKDAEDAIS